MVTNDGLNRVVNISSEADIVNARKMARNLATELGFGITDITRIVTAASELARNIFVYAGSGYMQWLSLETGGRIGIELTFKDNGPGIADVEQAMEPGYSTIGSLGLGMPGTKRLMDEMEVESQIGKGTTVTVKKWLRR